MTISNFLDRYSQLIAACVNLHGAFQHWPRPNQVLRLRDAITDLNTAQDEIYLSHSKWVVPSGWLVENSRRLFVLENLLEVQNTSSEP